MDLHLAITVTVLFLAGTAACALLIRPTKGRVAVAEMLGRIALLAAAALFALLGR